MSPLTPAEENRQRALVIAAQKTAEKAANDAAFEQKLAAYRQGIEDFIPAKATKFYQLCLSLIDKAVAEDQTDVEINTDQHGSVFFDTGLQIPAYPDNSTNNLLSSDLIRSATNFIGLPLEFQFCASLSLA